MIVAAHVVQHVVVPEAFAHVVQQHGGEVPEAVGPLVGVEQCRLQRGTRSPYMEGPICHVCAVASSKRQLILAFLYAENTS